MEKMKRLVVEIYDPQKPEEKATYEIEISDKVTVKEIVPYMKSQSGEQFYIENPPKKYDSLADFFQELAEDLRAEEEEILWDEFENALTDWNFDKAYEIGKRLGLVKKKEDLDKYTAGAEKCAFRAWLNNKSYDDWDCLDCEEHDYSLCTIDCDVPCEECISFRYCKKHGYTVKRGDKWVPAHR